MSRAPLLFAGGLVAGALGVLLAQQSDEGPRFVGRGLLAGAGGAAIALWIIAWRDSRDRVYRQW